MLEDGERWLRKVLNDAPRFHIWDGKPSRGGLSDEILRTIFEICRRVKETGQLHTLETGAGLSTLAFHACSPSEHVCIESEKGVLDRVRGYIERGGENIAGLRMVCDRAEHVLPSMSIDIEPYLDFVLLDGGHSWPEVFVQLYYVNMILKKGGFIGIDDLQLYSVRQMFLFLKSQPEWEVVTQFPKTAILKKVSDDRYFPHFRRQPFIVSNSVGL